MIYPKMKSPIRQIKISLNFFRSIFITRSIFELKNSGLKWKNSFQRKDLYQTLMNYLPQRYRFSCAISTSQENPTRKLRPRSCTNRLNFELNLTTTHLSNMTTLHRTPAQNLITGRSYHRKDGKEPNTIGSKQ